MTVIQRGAVFSPDRVYRYMLTRSWDDSGDGSIVNFIGLNPSTADEQVDDPTIRRCMAFARTWGASALTMTNLFALRSTDPSVLRSTQVGSPIGPKNNDYLLEQSGCSRLVVAAWGVHGTWLGRDQHVAALLRDVGLCCLGLTKDGYPKHPLYLRSDTALQSFAGALRELAHA